MEEKHWILDDPFSSSLVFDWALSLSHLTRCIKQAHSSNVCVSVCKWECKCVSRAPWKGHTKQRERAQWSVNSTADKLQWPVEEEKEKSLQVNSWHSSLVSPAFTRSMETAAPAVCFFVTGLLLPLSLLPLPLPLYICMWILRVNCVKIYGAATEWTCTRWNERKKKKRRRRRGECEEGERRQRDG